MATRSVAAIDEGVSLEQGELVARCLRGERDAQRGFYERYARFVLRTARRLGTPPEEIEDVAQEIFTIAFRKMNGFHGGRLSTWLYRICANRVQHHHRSRRRARCLRAAFACVFGHDVSSELAGQAEPQERELSRRDAEREFADILALMAPKKREVLVLFEIEGLSGEAIAERVGRPLDTVWSRLYHARREFATLARKRSQREQRRITGRFGS